MSAPSVSWVSTAQAVVCLGWVSSTPIRAGPAPQALPGPCGPASNSRSRPRGARTAECIGIARRFAPSQTRRGPASRGARPPGRKRSTPPAGGSTAMSGFDINQLTISGNLTRDPELRTPTGTQPVCSIRIAHNERYKNSAGDWADRAQYFDVTIWGGLGEWVAGQRHQAATRSSSPAGCAGASGARTPPSARPSTSPPTASSPSGAATPPRRRPTRRPTTPTASRPRPPPNGTGGPPQPRGGPPRRPPLR